jgi:hypothetical protein
MTILRVFAARIFVMILKRLNCAMCNVHAKKRLDLRLVCPQCEMTMLRVFAARIFVIILECLNYAGVETLGFESCLSTVWNDNVARVCRKNFRNHSWMSELRRRRNTGIWVLSAHVWNVNFPCLPLHSFKNSASIRSGVASCCPTPLYPFPYARVKI